MKFIIIVAIITGVYVVGMDLVKKYTNSIDFSQITAQAPKMIMVQINGEVNNPGVYEIEEGSTLANLINLAGGLTDKADSASVKFTRVLENNTRYNIASSEKEVATLVNINTASVSELSSVPGIGVTIASRIVAYRLENGYFSSFDDLCHIKGIKEATLEKIKPYLSLE